MNSAWNLQLDRVRRGKLLVLVMGLVAAIAAFAVGYAGPTTYTARATLTTGSPDRAPAQDSVLAVGYVDYFNSSGYENKLGTSGVVPADVTLHATTVASSPIISIEATSVSPVDAAAAAAASAKAFRDDINKQLRAAQDETIAAVRKPFDDVRQANGVVSPVALEQLQDRINQINAEGANKLITLELPSGVTRNPRDPRPTTLMALIGGLVVGCGVVIASAMFSRRLRTGGELAAKVGLSPIVEIPAPRSEGSRRLRAQRFQQLVNAVSLAAQDRATVTVTSTVASRGCLQVARALAQGRAAQGLRTVLIDADLHECDGVGLGDIIADKSLDLDSVVTPTEIPNLREIKSGSTDATPFTAITYRRFTSLLAQLHGRAECVVVAAPPITEAAETQILCAATDGVLLVVDSSESRVQDTAESVKLLAAANATLFGTVIIDGSVVGDFVEIGAVGVDSSAADRVVTTGKVRSSNGRAATPVVAAPAHLRRTETHGVV